MVELQGPDLMTEEVSVAFPLLRAPHHLSPHDGLSFDGGEAQTVSPQCQKYQLAHGHLLCSMVACGQRYEPVCM